MKRVHQHLLMYLSKKSQSGWDFEADLDFARVLGQADMVDIIKAAMNSGAVWPMIIQAWEISWKKPITLRRQRELRTLTKAGLVESAWVGTGHGGKSNFGASRTRAYFITDKGRKFAELYE